MNSNNLQSAVETVREKINKIEDLIKTINPQIHSTLVKWGFSTMREEFALKERLSIIWGKT